MYFADLAPFLATVPGAQAADPHVRMLDNYKEPSPLVVLSNRIPHVIDGSRIVRSVSGLASSVEAALQATPSAIWLGWNGSFDNSEIFIYQAPGSSTTIVGMPLNRDYLEKYYGHVCNSYLFPLYCGSWERVAEITDLEWHAYRFVNQMFAAEACRIAGRGATVWINDFHLQLCPRLIKESRPDLRVIFFQHVPFPSIESLARIPWRVEILQGISSADRIGVQTSRDRENLLECQARFGNLQSKTETVTNLPLGGRVGDYSVLVAPAEIDTRWWQKLGRDQDISAKANILRGLIGNPNHVFVGVDRLEPAKGITQKIEAFIRLCNEAVDDLALMTLLQVAVASDPRSLHGSETLLSDIRSELPRIGEPSAYMGVGSVYLTTAALSQEELAIIYSVADTLVVTSLSEGMNLVVKEFVAFKGWDPDKLIVSRFAGVAEDLPPEILINPRDPDEIVAAMHRCAANTSAAHAGAVIQAPQFVKRNAIEWARRLLSD